MQELLEKCNPLGMFDAIASLAVAQNMRDLYRLVLVDTPLAPYFSDHLTSEDLDEMNIEVGGWAGGRLAGWVVGGWVACGMLDASAATGAHCLLWLVAVVPHPSCTQGALLSLLLLPCCSAQVMRNTLYKAYLDDFSHFVHRVGGTTGQVMGELLSFEVGLLLEVDLGGGWPPG